jgi:16S rRNA (guanine(966)-N(2))-methyltransferase RsmD
VRQKGSNSVRIIGGEWRSRLIRFPDAAGLRPTPDRVRETLFNWLGQDLTGRRCLDIFAGSGALGFEALSRGAAEVVMVESSRLAWRGLRATADELGAGARLRLVAGDALHFLAAPAGVFDIVFLDPPYGTALGREVLARLPQTLALDAVVYVESDSAVVPGAGWRVKRSGRAGAVHHHLIAWGDHDEGSLSGHV